VADLIARPVDGPVTEHGEGPVWDADRQELLWVDLLAGRVHRALAGGGTLQFGGVVDVGGTVGAVLPARGGGWVLAADDGFAHLSADGSVRRLLDLSTEELGRTRMNDAACDPVGRLLAGTMAFDASPGSGSFYRVDPDGTVTRLLSGLTISNGIAFSPDGTVLYLVDSGPATIWAFDYDVDSGTLGSRRPLVVAEPGAGGPDGLCTDDEGCLWVAMWGGGQVRRYAPTGELLAAVDLPVSQPTSCCFAGADGRLLVISTSPLGLPERVRRQEPLAGRLFVADVGVTGPAATPYAGPLAGWTERPGTPLGMSRTDERGPAR